MIKEIVLIAYYIFENEVGPAMVLPFLYYKFMEDMNMNDLETMFSTRVKPWHNLGAVVDEAPDSETALRIAGLNWRVEQKDVYTEEGLFITGYKLNYRSTDFQQLGIVTDRYKVVQNEDAFRFTDDMLGKGVRYETAGALQNGRRTWILAKLPEKYIIAGDEITPYFLVFNSHDGTSSIKVCMTPIRVCCSNTLNLALSSAKRMWQTKHTENIMNRMDDERETLFFAHDYMSKLGKTIDELNRIKLTDKKVIEYMEEFFPVTKDMSDKQQKNNMRLLTDFKQRYFEAPDLQHVGKNGYRFINAVSDFATHSEPIRKTKNYRENLFMRTAEGNPMIDKAYQMIRAVA